MLMAGAKKRRPPLFVVAPWLLLSSQFAALGAATQGSNAKPVIRIAHLYANTEFFTSIEFMMAKFHLPSNRAILPDYDVVVEPFPFEPSSGESSVRLVEALLAKERYHAVTGPWGSIDCLATVDLTAQARILHTVKGENVEFTEQRDRFPYVFRTFWSMDGTVHSWMYITSMNGWSSALGIWLEASTVDLANKLATRYGIEHFAIVAEDGEDWLTEAWQSNAVRTIRRHRMRVMMTHFESSDTVYQLVCRVHRARISGIQHFMRGSYVPGWFLESHDERLGDCTADETYTAVSGYIGVVHSVVAPGVSIYNDVGGGFIMSAPILEGGDDQSQRTLTCMPTLTTSDFFNTGELLFMGLLAGAIYPPLVASAQRFAGYATSDTDMVCASLLALHDVLYNKGLSLSSIEDRDPTAFAALIDSMSKVEFQGPAGYIRFLPNSSDPEPIYYWLTQAAVPGMSNDTGVFTALVTYPDGQSGIPQIKLLNDSLPLTWRDGSTGLAPRPHLSLFPNCGDFNAELVWDDCQPCSPGQMYDELLDACRTCASGDYQNGSGTSECISAVPGEYVNDTESPVRAWACPAGHECPQVKTVLPQKCPPGRYANVSGFAECLLCPAGRYQKEYGATECLSCESVLDGSTTVNIASTSAESCVCPQGSFRPARELRCLACPDGMTCPEGSDMRNLQGSASGPFPLVQEGYMTLAAAPLTVYRCKADASCPGGPPASCASLRNPGTVACGRCEANSYESGVACELCGSSGALPITVTAIVVFIIVAAATLATNLDVRKTPAASLTIVVITGMLFNSLQALGVFNQLAIPWKEPVKTFFRLAAFLTFDFETLKLSCVMGEDPLPAYAFRQVVPLLVPPVVIGVLFLKRLRRTAKGKQRTWIRDIGVQAVNSIGALYSLFFISIVISILTPYLCYRHPGSNGESVISAPSLLCFDSGAHTSMLMFSAVATLLIPIPFLATCGCAIMLYPQKVGTPDNVAFLHAFRFLFLRYSPKRYYFQIILLGRGLALCMIPALLRGQPSTQVLFMCVVLGAYCICIMQLRAWRAAGCPLLDAAMNVMMSIILTCGALFLDDNPHEDVLVVLTTAALVILVGVAFGGIAISVKRRLTPHPRYDFFICHHKAHAAAQARIMKVLLLSRRPGCQVFIDSDDLKDLDTLFDTVRCRVKHLVAYLTTDTLKRPWCAGEIVSAVWAKILITRLQTSSFVPLTEEQIHYPEMYVDLLGCHLSEYGIQWEHVSLAYKYFLSHAVKLDLSHSVLGTRRFDEVAAILLKQTTRTADEKAPSLAEQPDRKVVLSTDRINDEANAAAAILASSMSEEVYSLFGQRSCVLADYTLDMEITQEAIEQAVAVIILLTSGCLESEAFLGVVCTLQLQPERAAAYPASIPVNTPDFIFPPSTFFDEIQTKHGGLCMHYGGEQSTCELLRTFFKSISIFWPTNASQDVLQIQAKEVVRRIMRSPVLQVSTENPIKRRLSAADSSAAVAKFLTRSRSDHFPSLMRASKTNSAATSSQGVGAPGSTSRTPESASMTGEDPDPAAASRRCSASFASGDASSCLTASAGADQVTPLEQCVTGDACGGSASIDHFEAFTELEV